MLCSVTTMVRPAAFRRASCSLSVSATRGARLLGRLVQEQDLGDPHQRAGDCEHLLLAAAEGACQLVSPLRETRNRLEDALLRPGARAGVAPSLPRHLEVLAHREVGEDAPILGDVADAESGHAEGRQTGEFLASEHDPTRARRREADDAAKRRALAGAVSSEETDDPGVLRGALPPTVVSRVLWKIQSAASGSRGHSMI